MTGLRLKYNTMQNFKPYKITKSKPELKVSRPLLTFNACTICNTQLNPSTEPTSKHCTPCKSRIQSLKTKLLTIKQSQNNDTIYPHTDTIIN
jgi:hypothetical protein